MIRRLRRLTQIKKDGKYVYDGWLGDDPSETPVCDKEPSGLFHGASRDVVEVRGKGIIGEMWYGSLLEQYAGFLSWFKREFEGRYWHCLAKEIGPQISQINADY
jgi:hypothetical protein